MSSCNIRSCNIKQNLLFLEKKYKYLEEFVGIVDAPESDVTEHPLCKHHVDVLGTLQGKLHLYARLTKQNAILMTKWQF